MPFTSGGYMMSREVADILDKQRERQRQAMLDALNQRNVESQITAREAETKMNEEYRGAMAEERKAAALAKLRDSLPYHGELTPEQASKLPPGDIINKPAYPDAATSTVDVPAQMGVGPNAGLAVPSEGSNPNMMEAGKQYVPFGPPGSQIMVPAPPESLQPSPTKIFGGNDKQKAAAQQQDLLNKIQNDPGFRKLMQDNPLLGALIYNRITGDNPSADIFKQMVPFPVYDAEHNNITYPEGPDHKPAMVPAGTRPGVRSRPPVGGGPGGPVGYLAPDENGNMTWHPVTIPGANPDPTKRPQVVTAPKVAPEKDIVAGAITAVRKAADALKPGQGLRGWVDSGYVPQERLDALTNARKAALGYYHGPENVKYVVEQIVNSPASTQLGINEIMKNITDLSPEEAAAVKSLLSELQYR